MIRVAEYARLLGYPPGKLLAGAVLERAEQAMGWFRDNGRPVVFVRDDVAAITAGPEVEAEIARRWQEDRVDEAYFLDRLACAVVEQLAEDVGVSPGARGWDVGRHTQLIRVLGPSSPVTLLSSGMLSPVHSIIALVTGESTTCAACSFRCELRRSV